MVLMFIYGTKTSFYDHKISFPESFILLFVSVGIGIGSFVLCLIFLFVAFFMKTFNKCLFLNHSICPITLKNPDCKCSSCGIKINAGCFITKRMGKSGGESEEHLGDEKETSKIIEKKFGVEIESNYDCCPYCAIVQTFFRSIFGFLGIVKELSSILKIKENCIPDYGNVSLMCSILTVCFPIVGIGIVISILGFIVGFSKNYLFIALPLAVTTVLQIFFMARATESLQCVYLMFQSIILYPFYLLKSCFNAPNKEKESLLTKE